MQKLTNTDNDSEKFEVSFPWMLNDVFFGGHNQLDISALYKSFYNYGKPDQCSFVQGYKL